jgi:shikimate kinase
MFSGARSVDRGLTRNDDSRPIQKELTPDERDLYLDQIKKDMRYFSRSYAKADVTVHINGSGPVEAANQIKAALDALR